MKASYKIALALSVVVCVLAIVLIKGDKQPDIPEVTNEAAEANSAPQQRKTLLSASSGDGTLKSMVDSKPQSASNRKPNTIASDARDRIKAAQDSAKADTGAERTADRGDDQAAPITLNIGSNTSGPIALARTEAGPTKAEPQTQTARTQVDSQALKAILGPPTARNTTPSSGAESKGTDGANAPVTTDKADADKSVLGDGDTYIVEPGDILSSIAVKLYNDDRRWVDIAQANPSVDPTKLKIGQVLRLPDDTFTLSQEEPAVKGPGQVQIYTIQAGDNLSTVAQKYYNDPTLWRTIYNFNRDKIGDNPNAIQVDMAIEVPPQLTGAQ